MYISRKDTHLQFTAFIFLTFAALTSVHAVEITEAGTYVIDSRVDQVIISEAVSQDVTVNVVSGGVVEGNIDCDTPYRSESCQPTINVSGNGAVSGDIIGPGMNINLRDYATVNSAGTSVYGSLVVQDNARLETMYDSAPIASKLSMSGGTVGSYLWSEGGIFMDMAGGTFEGPLGQAATILTMTDGELMNGVWGNWSLTLDVKGGEIWGDGSSSVIKGSEAGAVGSIFGGAFNATADEYLLQLSDYSFGESSALSIHGGLFGNIDSGSGFYLNGSQILNLYGLDLQLTDGILSGHLRDGSYIDVAVDYGGEWTGAVNIYNVPEPASIALLGLGLAGIGFARRRKV